jgi:hypothetical protein
VEQEVRFKTCRPAFKDWNPSFVPFKPAILTEEGKITTGVLPLKPRVTTSTLAQCTVAFSRSPDAGVPKTQRGNTVFNSDFVH